MEIKQILTERGNNYGEFEQHARITQAMKDAMREQSLGKYDLLQDYMKEALEMICHKIGRIVNGNPHYLDSWVDLVGYTQLVIDQIEKDTNGN